MTRATENRTRGTSVVQRVADALYVDAREHMYHATVLYQPVRLAETL